ncbi:hypothetical protein CQ14_06655 [Bradyrhizobium lablabi]|uniref:Uncharacterized protein n=2 Tax=Bradyrhizobium lablabi TaxID=722472 RepID=A0A0R3MNJ6_9BRAD|nr:hypothetical protein CQ14_06655 [Bradyrhizobium lablabi]
MDFNNAPEQRDFSVMDDGTIAVCQINIRPGNAGEGGWLKRSKNGDSMGLDIEFTVVGGTYDKRKFWSFWVLEGVTDGHQKAADISAGRIRAVLESARGVRPDDQSDEAKAARRLNDFSELDGIRFIGKIGIERAEEGSRYKDKNVLDAAITPDRTAWTKVEQNLRSATAVAAIGSTLGGAQPAFAGKTEKPKWATG